MISREWLLAVGTGATAFLLVRTASTRVYGIDVPPSLIGVAVLAGAVTAGASYHLIDADSGRPAQSVVAGAAAFALAFFALSMLAYTVPAVRRPLVGTVTLAAGGGVAVLVAAIAWLRYPVVRD